MARRMAERLPRCQPLTFMRPLNSCQRRRNFELAHKIVRDRNFIFSFYLFFFMARHTKGKRDKRLMPGHKEEEKRKRKYKVPVIICGQTELKEHRFADSLVPQIIGMRAPRSGQSLTALAFPLFFSFFSCRIPANIKKLDPGFQEKRKEK